jgi:UDP-N-acetylmuramoyl-tripeptide--D-alanyl-D-alanine ligase
MRATDLATVARWAGGSLLRGVPSATVDHVSTDTRSLPNGALFVALSGENFNGHDFLESAVAAGASTLLVSQLTKFTEDCKAAVIHVEKPLTALQELAFHYRKSLPDLRVVGVTGSNGKTSTKDFLRAVLGGDDTVTATLGNLNNHIGLPLSILRAEEHHCSAVWEMGMSNPGEIERLAEIGGPDVAVITHIGTAHIEFMKTREAIALEKGMLVEAISEDGLVVLNSGDDYSAQLAERSAARVVMAGIEAGDVRAENLRPSGDGTVFDLIAANQRAEVVLPVAGRHMVVNALLAAAVAVEFGRSVAEVAEALANVELTGGRLQRRVLGGLNFLDDSYNANPDSMRAALATLADIDCEGRRIAVLGRMAELGDLERHEHRALGVAAAQAGVDILIGVGEAGEMIVQGARGDSASADVTIEHAADQEAAAEFLKSNANSDDVVLVKGSRSAAMEQVMQAFEG